MRCLWFFAFLCAGAASGAGMALAACTARTQSAGVEIFPTAHVLPSNLLRVYVYFPRPMKGAGILDNMHLLNASGQVVSGAFLKNKYDLWSPDRRRLTVLLDPARVKTGLAAHQTLGRALTEGATYTVKVSGAALDRSGCALGADTAHTFSVGPPDLDPPTPEVWALDVPRTGGRGPLTINLGDPHDHVSLAYRLRVMRDDGTVLPGAIALLDGERQWQFVPRMPWADGPYEVFVDPRLEDLAGNRPGQLFDRPVGDASTDRTTTLPFRPGLPSR